MNCTLSLRSCRPAFCMEQYFALAWLFDPQWPFVMDETQAASAAEDIMRLTRHHRPGRLAWLSRKRRSLALDPRKLVDDGEPNDVVTQFQWYRDPNCAVRRLHGEAQAADGFAHDRDRNAADG